MSNCYLVILFQQGTLLHTSLTILSASRKQVHFLIVLLAQMMINERLLQALRCKI